MRLLLSFFLLSLAPSLFGQVITASIMHDDLERDYILYVPPAYNADMAVPLVLNFHGYTSNATEQMFYGDFRALADIHNFIIVHPMGTEDNTGTTHWNVGWGGSTVDDVGFTAALIDTISAAYNINAERIYSTGMSNGGFMSYLLACELSDRIAAIASVTGTMNIGQTAICNPSHPIPVMEIHGTADDVVPYEDDWALGSETVIDFWVEFNNCTTEPTITEVEDTDPDDASTVEWRQYGDCDNGVGVELFKIQDGGHTWPGTVFNFPGTNYDINASQEIWRFFSGYDINGAIEITDVEDVLSPEATIKLYPNPTSDWLNINTNLLGAWDYKISNLHGQTLLSGRATTQRQSVLLSHLSAGMYQLTIGSHTYKFVKQ